LLTTTITNTHLVAKKKKPTTYPNPPIPFFLAFHHLSARFVDERTSPLPQPPREGDYPHFK